MRPSRLKSSLALLAVATLTGAYACSSGGGSSGNKNGGSGGNDSGGDGGSSDKGGSGGKSGGAGGSSSSNGGSGGSNSSNGGSGGSNNSNGGSGGSSSNGGSGGSVAVTGRPKFCDDATIRPAANDGVYDASQANAVDQTLLDVQDAPLGEAIAAGTNYGTGWKTGSYDKAKDGDVAVIFLGGGLQTGLARYSSSGGRPGMTDKLSHAGEIPPLVIVSVNWPNTNTTADWNPSDFTKSMDEIRAKFPKISTKPEYHVVTGGSTAGAQAFDFIVTNPTLATKALAGSPSLVCFMPKSAGSNDGYVDLIKAGIPAIRMAASVAECDIMGTLEERLAANCANCTNAGCVDGSACSANWPNVNKAIQMALMSKMMPSHLIINRGPTSSHSETTWNISLGDRLRWLFRDITCKK